MADEKVSLDAFGASFKGFLDKVAQGPNEEPLFAQRLRAHFGAEPTAFPIVEENMRPTERPNLQIAIDAFIAEPPHTSELVGVSGTESQFLGVHLADLIAPRRAGFNAMPAPTIGPVQYINIPLSEGMMACVQCGLYLVTDGDTRLAMLLAVGRGFTGNSDLTLEVMAPTREAAESFLQTLRNSMRARNVYRGHIISLDVAQDRSLAVRFHHLPKIDREEIILSPGVLERVERNTERFAFHREKLLAARRHLKRGILLHGPPGTGKTLTAMYLAGRMPNRTVILLTGRTQGLVQASCDMARWLAPSTVILEDVDLIAEDRVNRADCNQPLLFELMNEMDGLGDDADVLFVLTTNRPDVLEPALASRPGRVDQAIEIPLPDDSCRRRLLELYGRGMSMRLANETAIIERTNGVSAAFIRELLRKAALFAADDGGAVITVEDKHVEEAMRDLMIDGGALTRSLLGVRAPQP